MSNISCWHKLFYYNINRITFLVFLAFFSYAPAIYKIFFWRWKSWRTLPPVTWDCMNWLIRCVHWTSPLTSASLPMASSFTSMLALSCWRTLLATTGTKRTVWPTSTTPILVCMSLTTSTWPSSNSSRKELPFKEVFLFIIFAMCLTLLVYKLELLLF